MSTSLVWQVKKKSDYRSLPCALKWIIERKWSFPCVVTVNDIPYLEGLNDCGVEGAEYLIDLIRQYEEIELNIEC